MATIASRGSSVVSTTSTTWANTSNSFDGTVGTNPATYATWVNASRSTSGTITIGGYSFGTLAGTINSVTAAIRHIDSSTSVISSVTVQLQDSSGANIGSAVSGTKSTSAHTDNLTLGTPTLTQVNGGLRALVTITRSNSTSSTTFSLDQVDLTVDYTSGPVAPTVTTSAASSVLATTATGNGNVTSDGGDTITERGFVWSTSLNPTTADSKVVDASVTTGSYSDSMTGLSGNTLYHYRAYATNSAGTGYGADTTFTTGHPLMETLVDNFNDNSFDLTKWTGAYGTVTEASGEIQIACTSAYSGYTSNGFYDMTGSHMYTQIVQMPAFGTGTTEGYFQATSDSSNKLSIIVSGSLIYFRVTTAGVNDDTTATFNLTTHKWWRIRESGGSVFFDTSTDGSSWTNRKTATTPAFVTSVAVDNSSGYYGTETSPGSFIMDNFNTLGSSAYTQSLTGSMTPSGAFTKTTSRSFSGSLPLAGALAKKLSRSLSGSLGLAGVLSKKTFYSLTGSLGLSGVVTGSHVIIKALTGSLGLSGSLSRKGLKSLSGSLPLSGVISRKTFRSLSGSLGLSGALSRNIVKLMSFTASLGLSGSLSRKTLKKLSGSLSPSGAISRVVAYKRSLSGSLGLSGSLKKRTAKKLTGALTMSGSLAHAIVKIVSFTASLGLSGNLTKQTRKSFAVSLGFVTAFTAYIPPKFKFISRIINSFKQEADEQTGSSRSTVQGTNQIAEVSSNATIEIANSSATSGTLQSQNQAGTVETTNTNQTLD